MVSSPAASCFPFPAGDGLPYGGFHKWGTPIAGWFIMEDLIRMDDERG